MSRTRNRKRNQFSVVIGLFAVISILLLPPLYAQITRTVTNDSDSGAGSLRDIIENSAANGDTIVFASDVKTITLLSDLPPIFANNLTFDGGDEGGVTIDGNNNLIFYDEGMSAISSPTTLTLNNLTLQGGHSAFRTWGVGTIKGSRLTFIGNEAVSEGGAIATGFVLLGDSVTFIGNSSGSHGGAIYSVFGGVTLGNNATFEKNSASGSGGAIFTLAGSGDYSIGNNSTFSGNSSGGGGGAISHDIAPLTFGSGALFERNSARGLYYDDFGSLLSGGSIGVLTGVSFSGNTLFTGNLANQNGGAVATYSGTVTLDTVVGNIAFSGNKSGVTFTEDSSGEFTPSDGVANSIHFDRNATLLLQGNNNIYFDDPISSGANGGNSLVKTGNGFVQFLGESRLNTTGFAGANSVDIQAGTFRLADLTGTPAVFDASGAGNFNIAAGATLAGQGTVKANGFSIAGTLSPDSDRFEIPTYLKKGDPGTTATEYNYFLNDKPTTVSTGKSVGTLTLAGNVVFDDAAIQIDTSTTTNDRVVIQGAASIAAGKSLTLGIAPTASLTAHSFDFTTGTLNINGYTSGNVYQSTQTVIETTGGITNFDPTNPANLTINNQSTVDYLSARGIIENNQLKITADLRWHSTDPTRQAHGTFAIAGGEVFTLGTPLGNNTGSNRQSGWDGTSLTKSGEGTLILTGQNTYTGNTLVSGGTLIAGSTPAAGAVITGMVTVNSGATLGGHGSIGGLTLNSGAKFAPGYSIGTTTITGNAGFNAGSMTEIELELLDTNTESDLIVISGNVTIEEGAELHITDVGSSTQRPRTGDNFLVIAANENQFVNTGQEFTLNGNWGRYFSQAFDFNGTYGTGNGLWIFYDFSGIEFETIYDLATRNALNVALALEWMQDFGDDELESIWTLYNSLVAVSDEPEHLAAALAQLHGEVFASSRMVTANMQRSFQRRLPSASRMLSSPQRGGLYRGIAPCDPCGTSFGSLNRWASFTGDWQERGNIGDFSGYSLRSTGIVAGFDQRISRNAFAGVAFGYDNAYQRFNTIQAFDQIDVFRTMLYGGLKSGTVYADGYAGYTKNWHKTRRDIGIDAFEAVARSKYNDNMFSTGFEIGQRLSVGRTHWTPSIGLHYIHLSTPSVTETGAGDANLHIQSNRYNSLRLPIGAKLSREFYSRNGIVWTPEARAYYIREMGDPSARVTTSFNNVRPISFAADTGNWGRNSGRLGVGVNAQLTDRFNLRVDYDCEVYDYTSTSEFGATLGVTW